VKEISHLFYNKYCVAAVDVMHQCGYEILSRKGTDDSHYVLSLLILKIGNSKRGVGS
jgi:hypothetical protein